MRALALSDGFSTDVEGPEENRKIARYVCSNPHQERRGIDDCTIERDERSHGKQHHGHAAACSRCHEAQACVLLALGARQAYARHHRGSPEQRAYERGERHHSGNDSSQTRQLAAHGAHLYRGEDAAHHDR